MPEISSRSLHLLSLGNAVPVSGAYGQCCHPGKISSIKIACRKDLRWWLCPLSIPVFRCPFLHSSVFHSIPFSPSIPFHSFHSIHSIHPSSFHSFSVQFVVWVFLQIHSIPFHSILCPFFIHFIPGHSFPFHSIPFHFSSLFHIFLHSVVHSKVPMYCSDDVFDASVTVTLQRAAGVYHK